MTDQADIVRTIQLATGTGAVGLGAVAVVAPEALTSAYGFRTAGDEQRYLVRLWGASAAALGALTLLGRPGHGQRTVFGACAAMNVLDAAVAATTPGLSVRTRVMAGLTSVAFAGALLHALTQDD